MDEEEIFVSEEELLGTVIKAVFKHKLGEDVLVEEDDVQQ